MRFEVSRVLDAIEERLSTDPALVRAVVDLGEVVRYADLDGGRPASLLRLGQAVDALGRQLGEDGVAVFAVADRSVLADGDLTSNERMVLRRWSDDGLVEVLPAAGDRVFEVADLTGLPVLTRREAAPAFPWFQADPSRRLAIAAGPGGATLRAPAGVAMPGAPTHPAMGRLWRCAEPGCASYGPQRTDDQPPPRLRAGVPVCPRHDQRLADAGPRPAAVTLSVRIDGVIRRRFTITEGAPVTVGREPAEERGVRVGPWLAGDALAEISRSHVVVSLTAAGLEVVDTSTNGTVVRRDSRQRARGASEDSTEDVKLGRGDRHLVDDLDVIELHSGVELVRRASAGASAPRSVMADAPTIALRLPPS